MYISQVKKKFIPSKKIPYFAINQSKPELRGCINGKSSHLGQSFNQEKSLNISVKCSGLYLGLAER